MDKHKMCFYDFILRNPVSFISILTRPCLQEVKIELTFDLFCVGVVQTVHCYDVEVQHGDAEAVQTHVRDTLQVLIKVVFLKFC